MELLQSKSHDLAKRATRKKSLTNTNPQNTSKILTISTGRQGEQLAKKFLLQKGYFSICENYHIRGGEIDLIMKKDDIIIFVEVKTRHGQYFGEGHEAVNGRKKIKLIRTIMHYLNENYQHSGQLWQLDVIGIQLQPEINRATIKHYQNILLK